MTRLLPCLLLLTGSLLGGCDGKDDHGHAEHAEHDEHDEHGQVRLTAAQAKAAKLETAAVGSGTVAERLTLTAVVHENVDAQAHLTPKVPGLVRKVHKQLGDRVEPGEVLCELESTVLGEATSVYMEARAMLDAARDSLRQETALLTSSVHVANTIFERERKLKQQAITTMRPYYQAEKALAQARLNRDSRVLALQREVRQRAIQLHTAEERLKILGLDDADLKRLDRDDEHGHGRYVLRAPRAGVIVTRDITANEYVDTSSKLFLIQDLRQVWVVASVYEADLRRVERGQAARVRLEAFPDVTLRGRVTFLDFRVDRTSRSCKVRIELPNDPIPGWKEPFPLRPGLFGTVELIVGVHAAAVAVPERALVHEGQRNFVFVETSAADAEERTFRRRAVQVGARGVERVQVTDGLKAGERVAVEGVFTLKSAARRGELGGGHSH